MTKFVGQQVHKMRETLENTLQSGVRIFEQFMGKNNQGNLGPFLAVGKLVGKMYLYLSIYRTVFDETGLV